MRAATLFLELGDRDGYRRTARAMLEQFQGSTEPSALERTAKVGLLTAPPDSERARLTSAAIAAVTRGADSSFLPWYQLARGMAAYRDGQFRGAVELLQKVQDSASSAIECKTAALLFLAMSESRLGDVTRARRSLDVARRALEASAPQPDDLGGSWPDWLICQIALREAEAVILYDAVFPADPFARAPSNAARPR